MDFNRVIQSSKDFSVRLACGPTRLLYIKTNLMSSSLKRKRSAWERQCSILKIQKEWGNVRCPLGSRYIRPGDRFCSLLGSQCYSARTLCAHMESTHDTSVLCLTVSSLRRLFRMAGRSREFSKFLLYYKANINIENCINNYRQTVSEVVSELICTLCHLSVSESQKLFNWLYHKCRHDEELQGIIYSTLISFQFLSSG